LHGSDQQVIERFLLGWPPFASLLASSRRRAAVLRFLATESAEERAQVVEATNPTYVLHRVYDALGILRPDRSDPAAALLAMPRAQVAEAIRAGNAAEWLVLLQRTFEFGRHPIPPANQAARLFLLEIWEMPPKGPGQKFCIFINGIPFSDGGKPHEEIVRVYTVSGYGSGPPVCAGFIYRTGHTEFVFDYGSTTYRSGWPPDEARKAIQRWIRATGGDDKKTAFAYRPAAAEQR
jgi:hypothetical protein